MDIRFYKCAICGQIVRIINDSGVTPICCGEEMEELIPGTKDASHEKHVPVIDMDPDMVTVSIGLLPHPMTKDHQIEWIVLQTEYGDQYRRLMPDEKPEAFFRICRSDKVKAAYAYCNLHGLWKAIYER